MNLRLILFILLGIVVYIQLALFNGRMLARIDAELRQLAAHLGLHWQQLVQTARGEARAAGERARWVPASTVVQ